MVLEVVLALELELELLLFTFGVVCNACIPATKRCEFMSV